MFTVIIYGDFDWAEPPVEFADRTAAVGHARSVVGRLMEEGAPNEVLVTVMHNGVVEITYSVASWRLGIRFIGDKAYN